MDDVRSAMLLDFVRRNFSTSNGAPIQLDTPLLSEQIVDSMGITLLSAFVEEQFRVPFDGTELRKGRLETVRAVAALVDRLA
jgi:acyl carrier protein